MGLDMSVVRTGKNIDLGQLYAVRSAVVDGMDWYLGDDPSGRYSKYLKLKTIALSLSRDKVLKEAKVSDDTRKYLANEIPESQFSIYLSEVVGSISDFASERNTHLNFDFDMLPGTTILDSCSWNLKDVFDRCAKGKPYPDSESVIELDMEKISRENSLWRKNSFKIGLARIVEWFAPEAGLRMAMDCARSIGLQDSLVDVEDIFYYSGEIEKVAKFMNPASDRLWLVSSY